MRPRRLELKGFTAFREPAAIDFTDLDVFAISGPTGSGKSSLLDAMTYALFGRVERVGDRVSQLISQGQPRMAVTLEFDVGPDRYQLTRSTPAKGATKIQLMQQGSDGGWEQAGEGSDRVRDVETRLKEVIGLDYHAFTRSVLLPQGRFAEFLVGDPGKRREILTSLLGLSLFDRLKERAGAVAKEAADRAQWTSAVLGREFADATPEALKEARAAARASGKREKALTAAAREVLSILERWREADRSVEELRACAHDADRAADLARSAAGELTALAARLADATSETQEARLGADAATGAFASARAALADADRRLGSAEQLAGAQVSTLALGEAHRARGQKQADRAKTIADGEALSRALAAADEAVAGRGETLSVREREAGEREAAMEQARHADLVSAVSLGVKPGDPCPVCGTPLERVPKRTAAGALDRATRALEAAKLAVETARGDLARAERSAESTRRDVGAAAAEGERLAREIRELDGAVAGHEATLRALLGDPLPDDPSREVERRLEERRDLDQAEREAEREAADRTRHLDQAERDRDMIASQIERQRDRLALDHGPLFERAARALGAGLAFELPSPVPDAADPAGLRAHADEVERALGSLAERLADEVERRGGLEGTLLMEALERTAGLGLGRAESLEDLAGAVTEAVRTATAEVATATQRAADLAARLERRTLLVTEIEELERRAALFRTLAQELRADRLIAFLQAEALQLLAAAGSERLRSLSDGRYRLVCRDDEFLVVDTWNGDEERSVRTLSGGETFLASLALALALADQVRSLSVTDRARLDSLFLDEGFGTLDPDSLRTVTDAIEQLAGDGRLVGVITHVRELAEQFPRVEVDKQPSGSRLQLVP